MGGGFGCSSDGFRQKNQFITVKMVYNTIKKTRSTTNRAQLAIFLILYFNDLRGYFTIIILRYLDLGYELFGTTFFLNVVVFFLAWIHVATQLRRP